MRASNKQTNNNNNKGASTVLHIVDAIIIFRSTIVIIITIAVRVVVVLLVLAQQRVLKYCDEAVLVASYDESSFLDKAFFTTLPLNKHSAHDFSIRYLEAFLCYNLLISSTVLLLL